MVLTTDIPSLEIQRLFNPAYCACMLARYAYSYRLAYPEKFFPGVPYSLAFLCLPLAFHAETRIEINKHSRTYGLHRLVREKPHLLVSIAERINSFADITKVALLFGLKYNFLDFNTELAVFLDKEPFIRQITKSVIGEEAFQPIHVAGLLGTWFSQLTVAEVFLYLGVQP